MTFLFRIGFLDIHWVDVLDIVLVGTLLFQFYKMVKGTLAVRVLIGFLILYFVYLFVQATDMELLTSILGQFMGVGVIAAVILFQQEIKKFLMLVGKTTDLNEGLMNLFKGSKNNGAVDWQINPIIEAMKTLGQTQTGALMVVTAEDSLQSYEDTGDILDAAISKRLILSIFYKNSPLHDGAVIFSKGRIRAARCILPVTENQNIPANLGLRHRAAVGMTEFTNTLVLIVSEETGNLSVAHRGVIDAYISPEKVKKHLVEYLSLKA